MEAAERARQLRLAFQAYFYEVGRLPYPGSFTFIHAEFAELVANNFHIKHKPWLNPYELASISNYIALFGAGRNHQWYDVAASLNTLKNLWRIAEDEAEYSLDPASEATFVLRWVYQQIPFSVHPLRVAKTCELLSQLFSSSEVSAHIQNELGIRGEHLMTAGALLREAFTERCMYTERNLLDLGDVCHLRSTLKQFAANRVVRTVFYKSKLEVKSLAEKPYELNSLLRYPLIKYESEYYAPSPELIGYASSRGLFFRLAEGGGDAFRAPFVRAFEASTTAMLRAALPKAEILTEEEERQLGWKGKTNDVTLILGDSALLIECKLSALFVEAKRSASPHAIIADVRKQVADGVNRRGLFQLHDKCEAIRSKVLPSDLMQKYKGVKRFFPVLLLFDAIEQANAAETIGNIIKEELLVYQVRDFDYQIWHLEELSWLIQYSGSELMAWVTEKFSIRNRALGLNSFVAQKTRNDFLNPIMYMPQGDTRASRILLRLSKHKDSVKMPIR